jgi:T4 superinfection immunity protein
MTHLIILAISIACYFLPAILARGKKDAVSIFWLNLLLGWSLIGWIVALVWALRQNSAPAVVTQQQQALPQSAPLLCSNCGKYSLPDAIYCQSCGQPLRATASVTSH